MKKYLPSFIIFSCLLAGSAVSFGSSNDDDIKYVPSKLIYWFDNQTDFSNQSLTSGTYSIDASKLDDGFHTLCCQIVCDDGSLGPSSCTYFLRVRQNEDTDYEPNTILYWYDTQSNIYSTPYKENCTIDASGLDNGFHILYYQLSDGEGHLSPVSSSFFLCSRANEESGFSPKKINYWFDKNTKVRTIDYGEVSSIDVNSIDEGFHTLNYQLSDEEGHLSPVSSSFFLRIRTDEEDDFVPTGIKYWFDTDSEAHLASYQLNTIIDASLVDEGFHTFCCQLTDDLGHLSPTQTTYFLRPLSKENEAGEPESMIYWIDDNVSHAVSVPYSDAVILHELDYLPEGEHTISYQVVTTKGERTPARYCAFSRVFFDLYIKNPYVLDSDICDSIPLFAERPFIKLCYDNDTLNNVGHLHVEPLTTVSMGKFAQAVHLGYNNATNTSKTLNYSRHTTLVNEGLMRADSVIVELSAYKDRWHFISLPFNVNLADMQSASGVYWTIREYDGKERAQGNHETTWKPLSPRSILEANRGYIMQFTKAGTNRYDDYVSKFEMHAINDSKKNQIFSSEDYSMELQEHIAEFAHNRSWNLVGNPYPSFFDTRMLSLSNPITVWTGTTYKAVSPEDDAYILSPFEAFFMQRPISSNVLTFRKEGRQNNPQAREFPAFAPTRSSGHSLRQVFNLALSDTTICDEARIVINEDAVATYEVERDAVKFMSTNETVPQICSEYDGVQYAINERPLTDGTIALTLRIPKADVYTISLSSSRNTQLPIYLCDQFAHEVRRLDAESYSFSAAEGMLSSRFVLSFGEVTDLEAVQEQLHGRIEVFDINGRSCYRGRKHLSELGLLPGVYVVRSKESAYRIIIK